MIPKCKSSVCSPKSGSSGHLRILGVDPGSRMTGFGCVEWARNQVVFADGGTLHGFTEPESPMELRLATIYRGLDERIKRFSPQVMVVERAFFAKNAQSALKLGQARGVVLLVAGLNQIPVVEYSPTEVKQALTGHGRADKEQVLRVVRLLTGQKQFATYDASDALALALCHVLSCRWNSTPFERPARTSRALRSSIGEALRHRVPKNVD